MTAGRQESRSTSAVSSVPAANHGAPGMTVQKYGGSSLSTIDQIRQVARVVGETHRSGKPTVVVVSARGRTTDDLLRLAAATGRERTGRERTGRETDQLLGTGEVASAALLAIALQDIGVPAVSLTGAQAGIRAAGRPGSGVIADIDTRRLRRVLAEGNVAVVAGFQGVDDSGDVLTLGRGGSDTTAVALAAALRTTVCEICTDVAGVATADPRVVADARLLPTVDVAVMAEMSFAGARVLHPRAVELAARNRVELQVRNSARIGPGTIIPASSDEDLLESRRTVLAIAHDLDVAGVLIRCEPRSADLAADILEVLSAHAVPVDLVTRSGPHEDEFTMGFTIPRKGSDDVFSAVAEALSGLGTTIHVDKNVGKLSLIGMGLLNHPEYTARMISALGGAGISISWLWTSQIRTSVLIPLDRVASAVQLLHNEFQLGRDDLDPVSAASA
ncbi:MAG: aspartate kinase [Pseudonocardiaceae bacterium]